MALPRNYFTNLCSRLGADVQGEGYGYNLDLRSVGIKLDIAQDVLDAQVWQDVQKYMPLDTGLLRSDANAINMSIRGEVVMYDPNSDYGHYLYEGIKYVDPNTGKGAFFSPGYGYWSRPGVPKVPSGEKLTYTQPNATDHWGEEAIQNHEDEWLNVVARALR